MIYPDGSENYPGGSYPRGVAPTGATAPTAHGPVGTLVQEACGTQKKAADAGYHGQVLSWENSIFLDFNQQDYQNAMNSGKTIVLYFYAGWCPVCRRAVQDVKLAFNELESDQVVGFRVNYKDDDTDDLENQLAKEHGVAYQHTFIIIQNNERVFKTPEVLSKDRVLEEINKVL